MKFGLLLVLALGLTVGCGESDTQIHPEPEPEPEENVVRSEKQRITLPNVSQGDLDNLVEGNTAFALELLRKVSPDAEGNVLYSPHSISLALAMTFAGARNETEAAVASTMHFQLNQDTLHPAFNLLDLNLADRGQDAQGSDGTPFRLKIANALWVQEGLDFETDFLDTLALNYGAGVSLLDFVGDPEASRKIINVWVEDKTEDKIKDLLPPGSITNATTSVLTNAIYFNAAWKDQFPENTENDTFTLADGTEISVPMMKQRAGYRHTEQDDFHALEMPYDGDEVSMLILMPKTGSVQDLEANLTAEKLESAIGALEEKLVRLTFPKFKFETPLPLGQHLRQMGMEVAFTGGADFSGMSQTIPLVIGDVLHKAMIDVNEKGTEAAAATAVLLVPTSSPTLDPIPLAIDRPFVFLIRDIETNAVLFIGRLADPS